MKFMTYIPFSFLFIDLFIISIATFIIIAINGPTYNINPITPKLNKNAGNSFSIHISLNLFLYPFPNNNLDMLF